MTHSASVAVVAFLGLVACRPSVKVPASAEVLLERDRAWAALADADGPVDSVVAYWTSDARVILPGEPSVVGTTAIRAMIAAMRSIPGFHISWTPDSAVVSAAGDLGYTYGTNRITVPDSSGVLRTMKGRYITVWRKEPNGPWRCAFDLSNEGPRPAGPSQ